MPTATHIDRLRGLALFVAIVWSIALAFLILDTVTYRLIDWGYRSAIISDEYGMPTPSGEAVATCAAHVQNSTAISSTAFTPQQARLVAWKMGTGFGFAVALERAGAIDAAKRQEAVNEISPLSQVLLVPIPIPPPSGPSAGAIPEYGQFIEDDQACTSAFLAHRYGLPVSHLYKLGGLTGFAVVYRTVCPQCGALFVPQVRHHAKEAGLPEESWRPFTQTPPNDESAEGRQQKAMGALQVIDNWLRERAK
jgi:hypothetical protein